jgi:hypothetical protein
MENATSRSPEGSQTNHNSSAKEDEPVDDDQQFELAQLDEQMVGRIGKQFSLYFA